MLFKIILGLHILFGTAGLLLGTIILIRKKGDRVHKNLGKIFILAMVCNGLCAFYLSYIHTNLFLFMIGIFTIYLSISGYRMLKLTLAHQGQKPKLEDTALSLLMTTASLIFLYIAYKYAIAKQVFGLIFFLFGVISLRLLHIDYKAYSAGQVSDKLYGLKNHIGRMTGAYLAAFTAFIVVNNTFLPTVLAWCLPGLIGGVFISRTIRKLNKPS